MGEFRLARLLVFGLLFSSLCGCVFGQSATGTLQGTILDPGGATVPDVKIVIKNLSTGATRNTVSGAEGIFIFNSVEPATYDLTITAKSGFKTYNQKGIELTSDERRDLGKITLTLGSLAEQISVTAEVTPVQTASSENSKLVDSAQVANITVKGRDMFAILQTVPGINFGNALLSGANADATSNASSTFGSMQINGGGLARTNFTVDGVLDMDNGNNAQVLFEPTMDTIQEIRVLTSNYQAEFGHASSGQISVITKGGTRQFHGTAYVNKRHEMFNAKDFFTNMNGNQKTIYRYFVGGYTIGGPAYIPHFFNTNKDKMFFFWSQEYTRQKPTSYNVTAMVPTADQLKGNFYDRCLAGTGVNGIACTAAYTDNNGANYDSYLVDPTNGKAPLAGGNLNQLIGSSAYNAASAAIGQSILKYLPSPNLCTAAAGIYNGMAISPGNCPSGFSNHPITNPSWNYGANYFWTAVESHPRRNDTARVDYNITSKLTAFGRWSQDTDKDIGNYQLPVRDAAGNYNPFGVDFNRPGHGYAIGLTYAMSPIMVNEFTFGETWNGIGWYADDPTQLNRANMGNPPSIDNFANDPLFVNGVGNRWEMSSSGPQNFGIYVPSVSFGTASGRTETAPNTAPCWGQCPYTNKAQMWSFADNLSRVQGKHNLKAGIYVERTNKWQANNNGSYLGSYSFGYNSNNPLDTQDGYANAWLGNFASYSEGERSMGNWWFWQVEFYLQDTWRVTPHLTIDAGIRFYALPPITNVGTGKNGTAEFVLAAYNPNQAERLYIGQCVTLATMTPYATTSAPCPNNSTINTRAYDPVTNTYAPAALVGTFVPNSVANYPSTATPWPGMLIAGTDPRLPQGLYTTPFLSPAVRFGFAWDVFGNGRTAIRGGFGQFLNRLDFNNIAGVSSNPPVLYGPQSVYYSNITSIGSSLMGSSAISPYSMGSDFVGNQNNESTYNGSFMVQQRVGFSTVAEVSWVFNLRRHAPSVVPLEYQPLYAQYNNAAAWVNPTSAYLQNSSLTGYPAGMNSGLGELGNQYTYSPSVCPTCVTGYNYINQENFNETGSYEALNINVRRNMTNHLGFGWAFTWDKYLGLTNSYIFNNDIAQQQSAVFPDHFRNYGPSYMPTPLYFTANFVYDVPNLGERMHFKPLGWITDHWVLSGMYQWRSDAMTSIPTPSFTGASSTCSSAANCYPQWNWTGTANEGWRYLVTGDYHLSSLNESWSANPAGSQQGSQQGTPSVNGYPINGSTGNQIINTQALTVPFPCSQKPAADPHYGIGESLECFGNAGAGQLLNIPGTRVNNLDMTITKNFPLKHEGRNLQFRVEAYNLPNHTMFNAWNIAPSYDWRNWLQGKLVQTNANLNRFTGTMNPRQMSMSVRLVF